MGRLVRAAPLALACLTLLLAAPGMPAYAAGGAQIDHFEQTPGGLSMLVAVPADATVELGAVTVSVAGRPATAAAQEGSSGRVRRTAVLAMDTSVSMTGAKFAAAKAAAAAYVRALPADVYLGIVTFGGSVRTALVPTRDRSSVAGILDGLSLSAGTLLYDGVGAALRAAGSSGQRSILVLSDGTDTRSAESLARLTGAVAQADALLDVVAVSDGGGTRPSLQQLAAAGRGSVLPSDPTALARTFAAEAGVLARQVLVTAQLPAGLTATSGTVEVMLPTAEGGTLDASAYDDRLQASAPAPAADPTHRWVLPAWVMYAGIGALAVGLAGLVLTLLPRRRAGTAEELVTNYTARTGAGTLVSGGTGRGLPRLDAEQALASATTAAAGLLRRSRGLEDRIAHALDGAGSDLKPAEWLLLHVAIALVAGVVGLLVGGGSALVALVLLAVGVLGPWASLLLRRRHRRRRFDDSLPETLQLMSGSLSAGLSLAQTVDTVVREANDPIAGEFRRVLVETRLGVELEDALDGVADRFDSPDFSWVVMAIRIQRQVGGNLAELFDTVAATLRERQYVRRQVLALSAEGRLSAMVIGALPPVFLLYLLLTNRAYLHPLFHDPRGIVLLVSSVVWLGIGAFWMSRLVKVEV
ncbi:type II secretion system F family protein [Nocardioides sp. BP30]|uniref:type II secretion system F family protein n=1 Tax=Nocardioides sp. BP30 TaxID=3036374 RepID=UPI0024685C55|nr:type II secretion system F family protein [Nocardioides sp. BP30]WGL53809.1 type II secretion system F family protein [Nocardioides sp. BP30]